MFFLNHHYPNILPVAFLVVTTWSLGFATDLLRFRWISVLPRMTAINVLFMGNVNKFLLILSTLSNGPNGQKSVFANQKSCESWYWISIQSQNYHNCPEVQSIQVDCTSGWFHYYYWRFGFNYVVLYTLIPKIRLCQCTKTQTAKQMFDLLQ